MGKRRRAGAHENSPTAGTGGTVKWFQLESDMPHDPKIRAVTRALGPAGLGGLTAVWCHIARHGASPGRAINSRGEALPLEELQEASGLPADQFGQLLEICLRTRHFKVEEWERCRGIWIPAMERRADRYTKELRRRQQPDLFPE